MRQVSKVALAVAITAAICLSFWLRSEHRIGSELQRDNLRLQENAAQMEHLLAENQRLPALSRGAPIRESSPAPEREKTRADAGSLPFVATSAEERERGRLKNEVESLTSLKVEVEKLRADTRELRAAAQAVQEAGSAGASSAAGAAGGQFKVVSAEYGSDQVKVDVSEALSQRIRHNQIKTTASNNLKGDPDFGQVKHLTVIYKFGDEVFTNSFREGELVVLPEAQK